MEYTIPFHKDSIDYLQSFKGLSLHLEKLETTVWLGGEVPLTRFNSRQSALDLIKYLVKTSFRVFLDLF